MGPELYRGAPMQWYRFELSRADWLKVYRELRASRGRHRYKRLSIVKLLRRGGNHCWLEPPIVESMNSYFKKRKLPYRVLRPYRQANFHLLVVIEDQPES